MAPCTLLNATKQNLDGKTNPLYFTISLQFQVKQRGWHYLNHKEWNNLTFSHRGKISKASKYIRQQVTWDFMYTCKPAETDDRSLLKRTSSITYLHFVFHFSFSFPLPNKTQTVEVHVCYLHEKNCNGTKTVIPSLPSGWNQMMLAISTSLQCDN